MTSAPSKPRRARIGAVALIVLVVLTGSAALVMALDDWLAAVKTVPVVQATQDLPPLTVITNTHVATASLPAAQAKGAVTDLARAIGRVTTSAIAKGAALPQSALLALPADRWLLSVPISGTLPPAVGETVTLLGVEPGSTSPPFAVDDAVVVAVEDGIAAIAVAPDQARLAAPYLSSPRHLLVVRRLR